MSQRSESAQLNRSQRASVVFGILMGLALMWMLVPAAASAAECTDTWTGPAEGAWATPGNWSASHVPTETDVACIGSGETAVIGGGTEAVVGAVQGDGGIEVGWVGLHLGFAPSETTSAIGSLRILGGFLTGPGSIEITKSMEWEGGGMAGPGETILGHEAVGTVKNAGLSRRLVNEGELSITSGDLRMSSEATLENSGTLILDSEGPELESGIVDVVPSSEPLLINSGTIVKPTGSGPTDIWAVLHNSGVIDARSGSLRFKGSHAEDLVSGASTLEGDIAFNGSDPEAGSFIQTGGTLTVGGSSQLNVESGARPDVSSLEVLGWLSGPGSVEVDEQMVWSGGIFGSGATSILRPGAVGVIGSGARLTERAFVNEGSLTQGSGWFDLREGALLKNEGTFTENAEGSETGILVSGGGEIHNGGTFRKSSGSGVSSVAPRFENSGSIQVESGELDFREPLTVAATERPNEARECRTGEPVNCATGDFTETQTDLAVGGRGVGLDLTRYYSAHAAAIASSPGPFGYGWSSSFSAHLEMAGGGAEVTLVEDNGSTVPFVRTGEGAYEGPAWERAVLKGSGPGFVLLEPDQTTEDFSGAGRLQSVADRDGNTTTLGYTGEGQLETITDPSGRMITLTYGGGGEVESVEDPMGHVVHYTYESGKLKTVTLPGEVKPNREFVYDGSDRITRAIDGSGGETVNEYISGSRVSAQTDPAGRKLTFEYSPFHTVVTDLATGAVTDEWFTSGHELASVTHGYGTAVATTETFTYNDFGELTRRTDGSGHTTHYGYDGEGNRTSERDAEGDETRWTYNEAHQVTSETKPNGEKTTISLNAAGDPETVSRPAPESKTQTLSYEYGPHGEVEAMTDPLGHVWSYGYDKYGDRTSATDPEGDEQTWGYNEDSQVMSKVSPRGNEEGAEAAKYTTLIERDAQGRPVKVTEPLGASTKFAYDPDGNIESITDPNGHKTKFTYDADNERTKVERPNGAIEETGYDGAGQITSQIDGNKQKTTYVRNVLEQPVEIIDPLERKTTQTFDAAGNLKTKTDPDGRTTTFGYDKADRLKEIAYSAEAGQDVIFGYNEDGQPTSMVDGTGESTWEYDQLGRLTHTKVGHGEEVGWAYNLADEPVGLTYPNGKSISRAYDKAGRLESVTDWLGHTTSFAYNRDSDPTLTTFPAGTTDSDEYAYDRADRMSSVTMKKGAETLASLAYSRDPAGQLESLVSKGLPGAEEEAFSYDENERLTKAGAAEFGYDAANNITKAPGTTDAFDKASEIESATGAAFTFDKEGERTKETPSSGPATTYKYDQAGDLATIERAEEGETPAIAESFGYDGTGLLTSRTVGLTTAHFVWDLSESPELLLSDGEDSYVYGPGGLAVEAISASEVPTYLQHDQLGSTRLLTNSSGEVAGTFTYGPYGGLTGHTGTATTALGYAGQYTLGQSGLQYLRARFHDPATAQFMTRDPIESITRSPYGYAKENPVGRIDPSGLCGVSSVGDFLESINPISEENCAYEAASSASEAVSNISLPSTREAAEAEVGFFDGGTAGLTKYARELLGIGNGGLALCGSTYEDSGIAGAAVFAVLAPEAPEGALQIASRFPDASMWVARHGDEVNQVKDVIEEVIRHVVGK